jgi:predicted TIM-barrel fold metal-dependent hydrolase
VTAVLADAHLHFFSNGFPGRCGRSVLGQDSEIEAYEAFRTAHNIDAALVVGYEGSSIDPGNNRYIRSLAASRPWMETLAYAALDEPLSPDVVEKWIADGHVGVAVYLPDPRSAGALSAWPAETWRSLERCRAIISVNAPSPQIDELAPVVAAHAGCVFAFSHLGLPGRYSAPPTSEEAADRLRPLLGLAKLPHTMVKISGLYAVSDPAYCYPHAAAEPFIELLLDSFGPERSLWGSDFSPALDFVSFAQTVANRWLDRLTPLERDRVMGGNLLRLLGRPVSLLTRDI